MQNNFVIRVKKAVKRVAAVAGAALMASSIVAPAIAASLADLPRPFVNTNGYFDANVVVGSQMWNALVAGDPAGLASDLAGAIDVAAAFAQQAKGAAGAAGTVTMTKPNTPGVLLNSSSGRLPVGGAVDANSPTINTFNHSISGFEWLMNETKVYNSTDYPIYEKLTVTDGNLDTTGLFRSYAGVTYNITTNGTAVPANFDKWPLFGATYSIVSAGASQIRFGQVKSETNIPFGTTINVGTKATVKISDWNTANNKAKVTITGSDGHIWVDDYYVEGTVFDNTTNGYTITLKDVVISSILGNHIDIDWSTSSVTLKNTSGENNASALVGLTSPLANWTVQYVVNSAGLKSLAFTSPVLAENGLISLSPGQKMIGDYFNISFDGWSDNNYTSVQIKNADGGQGAELIYTNNATSSVSQNLNLDGVSDSWTNQNGVAGFLNSNKSNTVRLLSGSDSYRFQYINGSAPVGLPTSRGEIYNAIGVWQGSSNVWNLTAVNATVWGIGDVSHTGVAAWAYAIFNTSGAWYNISFNNATFNISLLNWSSNSMGSYTGEDELGGQYFADKLSYAVKDVHEFNSNATLSGTVTLTEPDGKTIVTTMTRGSIEKVEAPTTAGTVANGATKYTYYGTAISPTSSNVILSYPQGRRTANIWIGRSSTAITSFAVGDKVTGTDYTISAVGAGGSAAVNAITPGIGITDQDVVFTSISKPTILIGGSMVNEGVHDLGTAGVPAASVTANRAYIQLVENAFGTSQPVLVVAGYAAKDTKLACQVLAAKVAGLSNIALTGTTTWLDTSGTTYSQVTVATE
ncbi:Uncharacterised protein [Candidatus Tiddalikarchaeum anstoanum]|nr:Uncharacterised protein [Candidatus Tiddalikarchaeum anstoanum]